MNAATSEMLIVSTVKPISPAPRSAASNGGYETFLEMARDVLHHHDRIVDDEAVVAIVSAISDRLSETVVGQQIHHRERADQ